MQNNESSPKERELTSKYITAYADIWADVILNKNLLKHLKSIKIDLAHLNELIDGKEILQENTLPFHRIANQLYRMQDIVQKKLNDDRM